MLNFSKTGAWLLVLLAGLTTACQRDGEPAPAVRYRIVKAAETGYNLAVTMTYEYNSQGKLMLVKEYPTAGDTLAKVTPTVQTTVQYNPTTPTHIDHTDRRLTKPYTDADGVVYGTRRVFSYDSQGRLSTVTESKALDDFKVFALTQTFTYAYGSDNLPTTLTVAGGPLQERNVYTYTFVNGNAVRIRLSVSNARSPTPTITESDVRFDNAPGVYYGFFAIYPGITSFNKNNVINTNTTMFHDDRGLLVKRVRTGNYVDNVTLYSYETY